MGTFTKYRGTAGVFARCPVLDLIADPTGGFYWCDDFLSPNLEDGDVYNIITDSSTTVVHTTDEVGGVLALTTPAADNREAYIAATNDAAGIVRIDANSGNEVWWEARVKKSQITSGSVIVGLANEGEVALLLLADSQTDAAILDTSAPDFIGFITCGDSTVAGLDAAYMDQATVGAHIIHKADAHTWVADEYVQLGVWFDGGTEINYYINGAQVGTALAPTTAEVPNGEELTMIAGCKTSTTAANVLEIDYWRIAMSINRGAGITGTN